jgi:hypothetical protein
MKMQTSVNWGLTTIPVIITLHMMITIIPVIITLRMMITTIQVILKAKAGGDIEDMEVIGAIGAIEDMILRVVIAVIAHHTLVVTVHLLHIVEVCNYTSDTSLFQGN